MLYNKDMHSLLDHVILQTVQGRGAAILKARKLSSAMSAAKAIVDHMRDWWNGTPQVIQTDVSLCTMCVY